MKDIYSLNAGDHTAHEEKWGRFNDPPKNFKEVSDEELIRTRVRAYAPTIHEYRQVHHEGKVTSVTLFFNSDDTGWGWSEDYHGKKTRYFIFGLCPGVTHKFRIARNTRKCLNIWKCENCPYEMEVDSSD